MRVVAKNVILGSMWLLLARVAAAVRMNVDVRIPRVVVRDNVQESMEGGLSIKVSEGRQRAERVDVSIGLELRWLGRDPV